MKKIALITACSVALAAALNAQTATVTTDPVGFVSVTVPANSDAVLAVPLNRASEFKGTIASVSGNIITVSGSPAWTANQFVSNGTTQLKTYALQLASGTQEGLTAKITANAANTVTVQFDAGDSFAGVVAGDQVDILPYWTPGSLFSSSIPVGTEFLGFTNSIAGVNKSSNLLFGYTGAGWEDEITSDDVTNMPLTFASGFILRNNSGTALSVTTVGSVPMNSHRIRLATVNANSDQDLYVGYLSPVPEAISGLGIPALAGDAIFGFDNSASGKNKAASVIYAYDGAQWVNDITGDPLTAADKLQPGFGYIYRKFRTGTASSVVWQKVQSYLAP